MSSPLGQLHDPSVVLKRVFESVNQIRNEYGASVLAFSKDLSFIAGEFAVKLSYGNGKSKHDGFLERKAQAPLAITFTENVAWIPATSKDPAHDAIISWISRPSSLSRINSESTHAGVGVAENDAGAFSIVIIFATLKSKYNKKQMLLLVERSVNSIRKEFKVPLVTVSFVATSRLKSIPAENLIGVNNNSVKGLFQACFEADSIREKFPSDGNDLVTMIKKLSDEKNLEIICKREYNEIGFILKKDCENQAIGFLAVGKSSNPYRNTPYYQQHYITAYNCLQLINDYRMCHNQKPLYLSHQWCFLAEKYSEKMESRVIDVDTSALTKKINHFMHGSKFTSMVYIIPISYDPLRDLLLLWTSSSKGRKTILDPEAKHIGFGIKIHKNESCYVTFIIGVKVGGSEPYQIYEFFYGDQLIYESLTSSDESDDEDPILDSGFRLTP